MAKLLLILNLFILLNVLVFLAADGVHIQAYEHSNLTGLLWNVNATEDCMKLPDSEISYIHSIRTEICFIGNCGTFWSQKYLPGDIHLSENDVGRFWPIKSVQACNDKEGGNQLNVDITMESYIKNVLESYENVCSCVNVPQYIQNMTQWTMNNHHNSVLAYYEPNCSTNKWDPEFLAAGLTSYTRFMHYYEKTDVMTNETCKIQSFGPDPNSTYFKASCNTNHIKTQNMTLNV